MGWRFFTSASSVALTKSHGMLRTISNCDSMRRLALYRRLYDIEDQARGKSPEEVLALRRESSASSETV